MWKRKPEHITRQIEKRLANFVILGRSHEGYARSITTGGGDTEETLSTAKAPADLVETLSPRPSTQPGQEATDE